MCYLFRKCLLGLLAMAISATVIADDKKEEMTKDRQLIKGSWKIVALTVNGKEVPKTDAQKITVENGADGGWTLYSDGKVVAKGTSNIDPTARPKSIDFTSTEGDSKGNKYCGIYELGE